MTIEEALKIVEDTEANYYLNQTILRGLQILASMMRSWIVALSMTRCGSVTLRQL